MYTQWQPSAKYGFLIDLRARSMRNIVFIVVTLVMYLQLSYRRTVRDLVKGEWTPTKEATTTTLNRMSEFIRAAGGVVWRNQSRLQLAVIRDYKDEWSLPKGKLERNEKWERAAIREVKEETKCVAKICKFGSVSHYWVSLARPDPTRTRETTTGSRIGRRSWYSSTWLWKRRNSLSRRGRSGLSNG